VHRATQWGYSLFEVVVNGGAAVAVDDQPIQTPVGCALEQCYPNPFNPTTRISYRVGRVVALSGSEGPATKVRLAVYDLLGREVALLVDEAKRPGEYTVTWDAGGMASGVYVYRLTSENFNDSKRMILIK